MASYTSFRFLVISFCLFLIFSLAQCNKSHETSKSASCKPDDVLADGFQDTDEESLLASPEVNSELKKICKETDHPGLCIATSLNFPRKQIDPKSILEGQLEAGKVAADYAHTFFTKIAGMPQIEKEMKEMMGIFKICRVMYEIAVHNYDTAVTSLSRHDMTGLKDVLESTIPTVEDCEDEFADFNATHSLFNLVDGKSLQAHYAVKVTNITSNCISVASLVEKPDQ